MAGISPVNVEAAIPFGFTDALRGYAFEVLQRDGFRCRSSGWDGSLWPNWLFLSWDRLLPLGHPQWDNPEFIVAVCRFCKEACNRTIWEVDGRTPDQLVAQKRPTVLTRRDVYDAFWRTPEILGPRTRLSPTTLHDDAPREACPVSPASGGASG